MKSAFARIREFISRRRNFSAFKRVLIKKSKAINILENWKINSSTAAIGCEYEM